MKKKRKNLYLSKETIAMLTGGTTIGGTDAPESTLPACTSICSICPDTTGPVASD